MKSMIKAILGCTALGWMLAGCSNELERTGDGTYADKPFEVTAQIIGAYSPESRAKKDEELDSYLASDKDGGFEDGDEIGFYSMYDENGNGEGYSNELMTYDKNSFKSDKLVNITHPGNMGYVFAYYPYQADREDNELNIYGTRPGYDNEMFVEDILIARTSGIGSATINFAFVHAFSMLLIIPGDGFSNYAADDTKESTNKDIKVVLKNGMKAIVEKDKTNNKIDLIVKADADAQKEFIARKATNVAYEEGAEAEPAEFCYYVILPNNAVVDYIEMYNDNGELQRVRPGSKLPAGGLARSWRYPLEVVMEGTEPVIWPHEILPWEDTAEIKLNEDAGIDSADDLMAWASAYNAYVNGETSREETLAQYGSKDEADDTKWHFQLNADIDCSDLDNALFISQLKGDILDGRNHTLTNLSLTHGLIGNITDGGKVTNLNIEGITITSESTEAIGAIAETLTDGEISDCDVTGLEIHTKGPVGAIVGDVQQGTVSNNLANGILFGTETKDKIIGTGTATSASGNISSGVIFQKD